jgi:hypothetical protein
VLDGHYFVGSGVCSFMKYGFRLYTPIVVVVQTCAAVIAITANSLRIDTISSPSWTAPERQYCHALNAPVALMTVLIEKLIDALGWIQLSIWIDRILFVVLVPFLWYWVMIEIQSLLVSGVSVIGSRGLRRRMADCAFMALGVLLLGAAYGVRVQFGYSHSMLYPNSLAAFYVGWATVLIAFYGNDLLRSSAIQEVVKPT